MGYEPGADNIHVLTFFIYTQTKACFPVIARPKINAAKGNKVSISAQGPGCCWALTMDVALTLISLHNKKICDMAPDMILVTRRITAEYFLQTVGQC